MAAFALVLMLCPCLEIRRGLQAVGEDGVQQSAGADGRERRVDAGGSLLVGEFDDVGGTVVEVAAVTGGLIFRSPVG